MTSNKSFEKFYTILDHTCNQGVGVEMNKKLTVKLTNFIYSLFYSQQQNSEKSCKIILVDCILHKS